MYSTWLVTLVLISLFGWVTCQSTTKQVSTTTPKPVSTTTAKPGEIFPEGTRGICGVYDLHNLNLALILVDVSEMQRKA